MCIAEHDSIGRICKGWSLKEIALGDFTKTASVAQEHAFWQVFFQWVTECVAEIAQLCADGGARRAEIAADLLLGRHLPLLSAA